MSRSARLWLAVGSAAVAAAAVAQWLVVVSDHDEHKLRTVAFGLLVGWSFIASGLVAWTRRPENHTGRLLVAAGFTFFIGVLGESNHSLPFTVAVLLSPVPVVVLVHLLVAYPTGQLRTRFERAVVVTGYTAAATLAPITMLYDDDPGRCKKCPDNAFLIAELEW